MNRIVHGVQKGVRIGPILQICLIEICIAELSTFYGGITMKLGFYIVESRVIVILKGNVCLDEALTLKERLLEFLEQGYIDYVLDMRDLNYIDNSGLGVLVAIHKQALRKGGGMEIVAISKSAQTILELTQLSRFFPATTY